jgi:hypothetical protein
VTDADDPRIPDDLRGHLPSAAARQRAQSAGLDLHALKRDAPDQYRMLNAEELVRVAPELADAAAELVAAAWPQRRLYRVPATAASERLLAFPPLSDEEFARFDDDAAGLVARPSFDAALAFFRTVRDLRGTHRELLLPTPPDAWAGEPALVGPFPDQQAAEAWPAGRLPPELIADPVPYRGRWFCDVFRSDEDLLFPAGEGGA